MDLAKTAPIVVLMGIILIFGMYFFTQLSGIVDSGTSSFLLILGNFTWIGYGITILVLLSIGYWGVDKLTKG